MGCLTISARRKEAGLQVSAELVCPAAGAQVSVSPKRATLPAAGGSATVTVTANGPWRAL